MSLDDPGTLAEAARAVKERRISSWELTTAALHRAKTRQDRLNAFIEIEEEAALSAARRADDALARGEPLGPLHGVPLAHKDMYDRKGFVTGCGSKIRANHVAPETSTVMQRLETAGAISIGRLNMSEFAMGPTGHNAHHGRALNPIDPAYITGGSSSGSGSAVGGGVVLAALGSDTGGSIRLPAACCGVVGIKPTQGRVSRHGVMPLSFSQDCVGPLARSVDDAYLLLHSISGPDDRDTTCAQAAPPEALTDDLSALRIGILRGLFETGVEDEIAVALGTVSRVLAGDVASLQDAPGMDLPAIAELANVVAMAEAGTVHFDWMRERPEDYGPQIRMRLSQSPAIPAPIYLRALQIRATMLQAFLQNGFGENDVLIAPVMPFLPPLSSDVDIGASPKMNTVVSAMTSFTRPFSFLGLPVVTLPVAASANGLPIAIQIIARPWREDLAASVARHLERVLALPAFAPPSTHRSAA
ncbi:amidase [Agrobacterium albertimagni AOL15]|uniref:Indoleacetamide hydrolase n=1 Tax=Agrobacterium albertimagni AOL15 TaxID=1156935 RepID=K2Q0P3_9HYPH|nr:amidase [Agrobacterium albertimagni]EKF58670.1 amidase [Agrobacterium albertimagni AOL15]